MSSFKQRRNSSSSLLPKDCRLINQSKKDIFQADSYRKSKYSDFEKEDEQKYMVSETYSSEIVDEVDKILKRYNSKNRKEKISKAAHKVRYQSNKKVFDSSEDMINSIEIMAQKRKNRQKIDLKYANQEASLFGARREQLPVKKIEVRNIPWLCDQKGETSDKNNVEDHEYDVISNDDDVKVGTLSLNSVPDLKEGKSYLCRDNTQSLKSNSGTVSHVKENDEFEINRSSDHYQWLDRAVIQRSLSHNINSTKISDIVPDQCQEVPSADNVLNTGPGKEPRRNIVFSKCKVNYIRSSDKNIGSNVQNYSTDENTFEDDSTCIIEDTNFKTEDRLYDIAQYPGPRIESHSGKSVHILSKGKVYPTFDNVVQSMDDLSTNINLDTFEANHIRKSKSDIYPETESSSTNKSNGMFVNENDQNEVSSFAKDSMENGLIDNDENIVIERKEIRNSDKTVPFSGCIQGKEEVSCSLDSKGSFSKCLTNVTEATQTVDVDNNRNNASCFRNGYPLVPLFTNILDLKKDMKQLKQENKEVKDILVKSTKELHNHNRKLNKYEKQQKLVEYTEFDYGVGETPKNHSEGKNTDRNNNIQTEKKVCDVITLEKCSQNNESIKKLLLNSSSIEKANIFDILKSKNDLNERERAKLDVAEKLYNKMIEMRNTRLKLEIAKESLVETKERFNRKKLIYKILKETEEQKVTDGNISQSLKSDKNQSTSGYDIKSVSPKFDKMVVQESGHVLNKNGLVISDGCEPLKIRKKKSEEGISSIVKSKAKRKNSKTRKKKIVKHRKGKKTSGEPTYLNKGNVESDECVSDVEQESKPTDLAWDKNDSNEDIMQQCSNNFQERILETEHKNHNDVEDSSSKCEIKTELQGDINAYSMKQNKRSKSRKSTRKSSKMNSKDHKSTSKNNIKKIHTKRPTSKRKGKESKDESVQCNLREDIQNQKQYYICYGNQTVTSFNGNDSKVLKKRYTSGKISKLSKFLKKLRK